MCEKLLLKNIKNLRIFFLIETFVLFIFLALIQIWDLSYRICAQLRHRFYIKKSLMGKRLR